MKINHKGMTLVEIIVSVGLISIVLIFLFRMLVDLRQEDTLSTYKSKDKINRLEIINSVQNDIIDGELTGVSISNTTTESTVTLTVDGRQKVLSVAKPTSGKGFITYGDKKWTLAEENAYYDTCSITSTVETDSKTNYYLVKILIPVKFKNNVRSSSTYDIEIVYLNKKFVNFNQNNLNRVIRSC